jgi:hypothetical protein
MLESYFTLVLCTPHFSKIRHPLKLSRYLFRGEFLTKILCAFFCSQHVYVQRSFDQPWFNRCNRVNNHSSAMCFTHLLLTPTQYSPQQIQSFLTCVYVLLLDQRTKFPTNIKHAELPFLLDVRLVASWGPEVRGIGLYCKKGQRILSFYSVLAVTRPYPISHKVGPGVSSDHSPPSDANTKNTWSYTSDII